MRSFWKKLLLSILIVNSLAGSGLYIYYISLKRRLSEWNIRQILERGKGELPPGFLAEALGLSQDEPVPWDRFDTNKAEKKLESFSFFKKVRVRKIEPDAVLIDYVLRIPVAKVADFINYAVDQEGVIFPLEPYYSAKRVPSIRFGEKVTQRKVLEAFSLIEEIKTAEFPPRILLIDLSESDSNILKKKQVVVLLEEQYSTNDKISKQLILLRLCANNPLEAIERWQRIRYLQKNRDNDSAVSIKGITVDLRHFEKAYIY